MPIHCLENVPSSDPCLQDWIITDTETTEKRDALVLAESMITTGSVIKPRSERSSYFGITLMFYGTAGQNVFTPSTLQQMCEVENLVLGFKNYPDVCVLSSTPNATGCIQQSTLVTSMFYDSSSWYHNGIKTNNRNCSLLSDSHLCGRL